MEMIGNDESALACYERSLEIRPGFASAIRNIQLLLKKLGYKEASKKYSTANRKLTAISDALNNVSFD
jgi:tetratricopeptide (TPR) repeat protein